MHHLLLQSIVDSELVQKCPVTSFASGKEFNRNFQEEAKKEKLQQLCTIESDLIQGGASDINCQQ